MNRRAAWFSCLILGAVALGGACGDDESTPTDAGMCPPGDCSAEGKNCGFLQTADGCKFCGSCQFPEACGGAGEANVCGCIPKTCESAGAECGMLDDGCGGSVPCPGSCSAPETCGGGVPNKCGQTLGLDGDCSDEAHDSCEDGLVCCGDTFRICTEEAETGGCPGPTPDLIISQAATSSSVVIRKEMFEATSCALSECLSMDGERKLLRFTTRTENIGDADLVLGDPISGGGDFVYNQCHEHYHFADYVAFRLLDMNETFVAGSEKVAFCVQDQAELHPDATNPGREAFGCVEGSQQGLQAGWYDKYSWNIDCQWIDVTDVPPGDYILEQHVNPLRKFRETRYDNNITRVPVTILPN